jgi:hypothetical protein
MRRAIEKLCFLLLSLAAASLISFVLLSRLTDARALRSSAPPLLFNPEPRNVQALTLTALNSVANGGSDTALASAELARLGGAAFPHVLPALDSLDPAARGRVALALAPVALRMGVANDEDFVSPERAVAFFARFWQDRSADFRSAAVRRKVARLAERALPLRRKEVVELDTFALDELLAALGRVKTDEDVKRAARLTPVLVNVTGMPWLVQPDTPRADASLTVTHWHDWALEHAVDFATLDGPGRLQAMVKQTRYFRWLASLPRVLSREDEPGARKLQAVIAEARSTLPTGAFALVLGLGAAALLARTRDRRARRFRGFAGGALALAALPLGVAALWAAQRGFSVLVLALTLSVAATASVELGVAAPARGRFRQAFERAGVVLPPVLAALLAGEAVLGRGLGALSVQALADADLPMLMWIAFALSGAGAVTTAAFGLVLPTRRLRDEPLRVFRDASRRPALIALSIVLLLALPLLGLLTSWSAGPALASALSLARTLGAVLAALTGAAGVGFTLGLFAGGLSRTAHLVLARALEVIAALPQPFLAAACFLFGSLPGAFALGCLRGFEIAQVLSSRIHEQRASDLLEPRSFSRAPLAPFVRQILPAALAPFTTLFMLSVPWLFTLEAASARLGSATLGTLASVGSSSLPALGGMTLFSLSLFLLARELTPHEYVGETPGAPVALALNRRTGISSFPPPSDDD